MQLSLSDQTAHAAHDGAPILGAAGKSPYSARAGDQLQLMRLMSLVKDMGPFLDGQGTLYCRIPDPAGQPSVTWPLESEAALSVITYRSFSELGDVPSPGTLSRVISLVRGELWQKRPTVNPSDRTWDAVVKAIKKSSDIWGDFQGSASEILERLKEDSENEAAIFDQLPESPDRLGIILGRIGLLLRQEGIELYRPPRTESRRLWGWRKIVPEAARDTPDTPDGRRDEASGGSQARSAGPSRPADTPDGSSDLRSSLMAHYRGDTRR
jgi:hypothetical protein